MVASLLGERSEIGLDRPVHKGCRSSPDRRGPGPCGHPGRPIILGGAGPVIERPEDLADAVISLRQVLAISEARRLLLRELADDLQGLPEQLQRRSGLALAAPAQAEVAIGLGQVPRSSTAAGSCHILEDRDGIAIVAHGLGRPAAVVVEVAEGSGTSPPSRTGSLDSMGQGRRAGSGSPGPFGEMHPPPRTAPDHTGCRRSPHGPWPDIVDAGCSPDPAAPASPGSAWRTCRTSGRNRTGRSVSEGSRGCDGPRLGRAGG